MRSKFLVVLGVTLFVLFINACKPETTTDNRTIDIRTLELPDLITQEKNTACKQILYTNFLIGRNGFESNIVVTCPDGTDRHNLIVDAIKAVWSPDGSQIAFLSTRTGMQQLYLMDPDGGNVRQITFDIDLVYSDWFWLPDGVQIAALITPIIRVTEVVEDGVVEYAQELFDQRSWQAINVDTNEGVPLTGWSDGFFFQYPPPVFTHDGVRIAYLAWSEPAEGIRRTASLHIQNIDGSDSLVLMSGLLAIRNLVWSPDDNQIAFLLDLTGANDQYAIYTVNPDGSNLQRITEPIFNNSANFIWSPDGESFAIYDNESLSILDLSSVRIVDLFKIEFPSNICCLSWQP